ncbi:hypothetical protein B0H10DRAFT_2047394 [Mycena sp. CBHHK59/15]|nr:hypothetical protein B0H10DRAFT_2047394 [Mycena sp. CBHHK59/15]
MDMNEDIFCCILSHIFDSKTLYVVLIALPKSHFLFLATLSRLWQFPIYLDSYDPRASAASQKVLDYLLDNNADTGRLPLAESVRHLVVSIEHDGLHHDRIRTRHINIPGDVLALQERLPDLFHRTVNLESLDYRSLPGIDMKSKHVESLQHLERLRSFAVDCALRDRDRDIPASAGNNAAPGELSARYDAENWEIEPFVSTVGPAIASLDLRHVNHTMFTALISQTDVFASYHALEHLKIDITEGVWDWGGGGSPAMGATPAFNFSCLGFPSVERFELVVCDMTLHGSQTGALDLVHCNLLMELSIDVRYSVWWAPCDMIKLFEALSPLDLPVLSRLEIKDCTRNTERHYWDSNHNTSGWKHKGRTYSGLVPSFLGSMRTGSLPNLTSLWVDERALISPHVCTVQDLLNVESEESANVLWTDTVRAAFGQLESLRVGFGAITHIDAGLILDLCDPTKLTQFGFEWRWSDYGRDDPISAGLLTHLSRFPKLTDNAAFWPTRSFNDARTLSDVASIFGCNGSICRVGIGNSVVWERHPSDGLPAILLVSDGSAAPSAAVSNFFHVGFMPKYNSETGTGPDSNNAIPPRPVRGEEIEQLRDLLQRIVT